MKLLLIILLIKFLYHEKNVSLFGFQPCVFICVRCHHFAQSGSSVASKITGFYASFIRPVLIAWVVIMVAIGGIMANNKVRKNEEESSEAMMGWFKMVIWPIVVLGVAELGNSLYS